MPKIICCDCAVELRPDKTGVPVVEMAEFGEYRIWEADRWSCPKCGHRVIAGFSDRPSSEHWRPGFAEELERAQKRVGYIEFYQ